MLIEQFLRHYRQGSITPLMELPNSINLHELQVPDEIKEEITHAFDQHYGMLIRYLKWQIELFKTASMNGITPLQLVRTTSSVNGTITKFKEEQKFIETFYKQNNIEL